MAEDAREVDTSLE